MAITPIDAFPARNSASFKTRVETFFETEFPAAITEMNTAIEAFNTNDLRGTSTTAYTPNVTGNKAFTTQSGKSWVPGMWVTGGYTSGGNEYWAGVVVSYSGTTLTVNVRVNGGTATPRSTWSISFSPPVSDLVGDHEVIAHSPSGYGSTNTKRRKYSTVHRNVGTAITYVSDAALGDTWTINEAGAYFIQRQEQPGSASYGGVVLNPSSGTANYSGLGFAEKLGAIGAGAAANQYGSITTIRNLIAGDVIAMHDDPSLFGGTSNSNFVIVRKLR
jgi:hypothetical protein